MPLLSERGAVSNAGYGFGLSSSQFPGVPFYEPGILIDSNFCNVTEIAFTSDGAHAFAVGYAQAPTSSWCVLSYTRNTSTGNLILTSTTVLTGATVSYGGCTISVAPADNYIYITYTDNDNLGSSSGINRVYQFSLTSDGSGGLALTALSPAYLSAGATYGFSFSAISPNGKFLYVFCLQKNTIGIYSVDTATGLLTLSSFYNTPSGSLPWQGSITADGKYLYVSSPSGSSYGLMQFSLNTSTGAITPLSPAGFTIGTGGGFSVNLSPDESLLFISTVSGGGSTIYFYVRDSVTGLLTSVATQSGNVLEIVQYSASGGIVYGLNGAGADRATTTNPPPTTFQAYVSSSGFSNLLNPTNISVASYMSQLSASPDRQYFYAGITGTVGPGFSSGIVAFKPDAFGYLQPINWPAKALTQISYGHPSTPVNIAISPNGASVYTSAPAWYNTGPYHGSQFIRNTSTGVLTFAGSTAIGTQLGGGGIGVSPDGLHVYSADNINFNVYQYSRNTSTGDLTALSPAYVTLPSTTYFYYGVVPNPVFSSDGLTVYFTSWDGKLINPAISYITAYSRNPSTGQLSLIASYTLSDSNVTGYNALTISPNNKFVYAVSGYNLHIFSRNTSTGALTEINVISLFSYTSTVGSMCFSSDGLYLYVTCSANFGNKIITFLADTTTGALTVSVVTPLINDFPSVGTPIPLAVLGSSGKALYVASYYPNNGSPNIFKNVYQYRRNATSGALSSPKKLTLLPTVVTDQGGASGVQGVVGLASSPDGKSLYPLLSNFLVQVVTG